MFDEFFQRPHRRHIKDLNLVPVIDMLTTVVFFLLLSANFDSLTKLTLPPSATVSVQDTTDPTPPVSPKLVLLSLSSSQLELMLTWGGKEPGETSEKLSVDPKTRRATLIEKAKKLVGEFVKSHPDEKSLQVGMEDDLKYQDLIAVMDGSREIVSNIVLISYAEVAKK